MGGRLSPDRDRPVRQHVLQVRDHIAHRLVPIPRIQLEAVLHDVLDGARNLGRDRAQRPRARLGHGLQRRRARLALEGALEGQELVGQHAEGEDVRARVGPGLAGLDLLRREVGRRAHQVLGDVQGLELVQVGQPEVHQPRMLVVLREEHVARLHVPVQDPALVAVGQALGDAHQAVQPRAQAVEGRRLPSGHGSDVLLQRAAVEQLHHQPVGADLVDLDHRAVVELGDGARLVDRPAVAGDDLDRHVAPQLGVPAQVDAAQAARAQVAQDLEAPELPGPLGPPPALGRAPQDPVGLDRLAQLLAPLGEEGVVVDLVSVEGRVPEACEQFLTFHRPPLGPGSERSSPWPPGSGDAPAPS